MKVSAKAVLGAAVAFVGLGASQALAVTSTTLDADLMPTAVITGVLTAAKTEILQVQGIIFLLALGAAAYWAVMGRIGGKKKAVKA